MMRTDTSGPFELDPNATLAGVVMGSALMTRGILGRIQVKAESSEDGAGATVERKWEVVKQVVVTCQVIGESHLNVQTCGLRRTRLNSKSAFWPVPPSYTPFFWVYAAYYILETRPISLETPPAPLADSIHHVNSRTTIFQLGVFQGQRFQIT